MGFDPSYTGDCSYNSLLLRNGCQGGPSAPIAGYTLDGDACQRGEAAGSYALEPLLEAYQVDLVLSGHTHDWEASWPVLNATLLAKSYIDPKGPVHVVNGAAGGKHGDGFGRKWDFTRVRNTSVGSSYTHVRAHNATHMTVEQHDGSSGHDGHLHHRSDGRARARSAAALCSLLPSGRRHNSPIVGRTSVGLLACLGLTGRRLTRRVREATTLAWNECKGIAEQTPHVRLGGRPPSSVRRPRRRRTTRLPVAGRAGVRHSRRRPERPTGQLLLIRYGTGIWNTSSLVILTAYYIDAAVPRYFVSGSCS
jgi:hypothetical protein